MAKEHRQETIYPVTISRKTASQISGIAVGTLANMASRREGPPFFRRGRKVIYDYQVFVSWLKEYHMLTHDSIPE